MTIKLYNTLTRKKENFRPLKNKTVKIYSCGPTVYWYQHIGNMRSYIFADLLRRMFDFSGYDVKQIINVTDVGHLTSDADEGEDKMEKAAKKEKKSAKEIADHYFSVFREDLEKLNIEMPDKFPRASEHIKDQIEIIKKLEKKGYIYKTSDGIYYDTSKFRDYGKLANLDKKNIQSGKRVSLGEKKNTTDFALWKFSNPDEKRLQEWNSPWGKGFPGWHIECSAMAMKYLGENFDIHTGGQDHIQIHHQNEIAQSEAATGKKYVNYWMHGAFLTFEGEKISKSKGGLYTISELEKKGFPAMAYRYLCLTTHYRKPLNFSLKNLESAKNTYERLKNIVSGLEDDKKENKKYLSEFEKKINDDLNIPEALQVLWKMLRDKNAEGKSGSVKKMDSVFGLRLFDKEEKETPVKIKKLAEERETSRKNKDYKKADELRDKIKSLGFSVEDTDKGPVLKETEKNSAEENKKREETKKPKFREHVTKQGTLILAGKNENNNEDLVKQAEKDEEVFHTKETGSPFVNIKGEPKKGDMKEAAIFCAKYSKDWKKNHKDIEVHQFKGKDIYKNKGMKAGTFGVKNRKIIKVKKEEIEEFELKQTGK